MIQQSHSWVYTYAHSSTIHNTQDMESQAQCPSTDEWIKKIWYIYIYIQWNNNNNKKEWSNDICRTWMDLEFITLSEVSLKEKDKHHAISIICGIYNISPKTHLWNGNRLTDIESRLWLPRGQDQGGMDWELGISRYKLLYLKGINNKILLYSTGNYIQ